MKNITTTKTAQSPSEIAAHLSQDQRLFILNQCADAVRQGKPLPGYKFDPVPVLSSFLYDHTEDAAVSLSLGVPHVALRSEAAKMVLLRADAMKRPKPDLGIDNDLADALARDDS